MLLWTVVSVRLGFFRIQLETQQEQSFPLTIRMGQTDIYRVQRGV